MAWNKRRGHEQRGHGLRHSGPNKTAGLAAVISKRCLSGWLRGDSSRAEDELLRQVHSQTHFQWLLTRERMRADRSGSQFALLSIRPLSPDKHPWQLIACAQRISARLRATDEIGRYGPGLAIILPDTSPAGARQLARDLSQREASANQDLTCEVLVYPPVQDTSDEETVAALGDDALPGIDGRAAETAVLSAEMIFAQPLPAWKRTLDILGALMGLILAAPALLIAAVAIKLTSPGPVLFRQLRSGLGGKPFTIYKLRTMYLDAEAGKAQLRRFSEQDGPAFKLRNDPRITLVGRYLRKTCIDELPQLWNVLRGEMSLVGPRPLPCEETDGCQSWQRRRLDVTPGLTCIWQARWSRRVSFADWMRMDIRYIKGRNLLSDLRLISQTLLTALFHRASC